MADNPIDSRIKMKGFAAKRTNTCKVGRTVQFDSIKMIWDDANPMEVLAHLQSIVDNVRSGVIPVADLVSKARLGMWLPPNLPYTGDQEHYNAGATNQQRKHYSMENRTDFAVRPQNTGDSKCYANLTGSAKGAAWHNIVLANDVYPKIDNGDTYNFLFVKDGPTWIPEGGYVGFHDVSQINNYTIDIETIIEKSIISKLDHILSGIGLSNDMLREGSKFQGRELTLEDFQ